MQRPWQGGTVDHGGPVAETSASTAVWDPPRATGADRSRLRWEVGLVLAVSLGQSAVYSLLTLARSIQRSLEAGETLGAQQAQLNPARDSDAVWDALYQVLDTVFALAVVGLVVYLLWEPGSNALRRIGLDLSRPVADLRRAVLLMVVVGLPGLALYAGGRLVGLTVAVQAAPLDRSWYAVPLLLLAAVRAGLSEEVVLLGYLFDRLRRLGWGWWPVILATAGLRATYHAYQGFGPMLGNFAMGILFGWAYRRWGRVMPFVLAHALIDAVAFVGYPVAAAAWPALFGTS